jgi:hypothetical protein
VDRPSSEPIFAACSFKSSAAVFPVLLSFRSPFSHLDHQWRGGREVIGIKGERRSASRENADRNRGRMSDRLQRRMGDRNRGESAGEAFIITPLSASSRMGSWSPSGAVFPPPHAPVNWSYAPRRFHPDSSPAAHAHGPSGIILGPSQLFASESPECFFRNSPVALSVASGICNTVVLKPRRLVERLLHNALSAASPGAGCSTHRSRLPALHSIQEGEVT